MSEEVFSIQRSVPVMDLSKVKQIFCFGVDSYFNDLLRDVDSRNAASKSRQQIEQLYAAISSSALDFQPEELKRGDSRTPSTLLVAPGTDFLFRVCPLAEGGRNETVALLAMDMSRLPESCHRSIVAALAGADEQLTPVRILIFVLTKEDRVGFQPVMLIAATDGAGSLVPVPHSFQWVVSGQVVGGQSIAENAEEEADRLSYLVHIVMNEDAAKLHAENRPDHMQKRDH